MSLIKNYSKQCVFKPINIWFWLMFLNQWFCKTDIMENQSYTSLSLLRKCSLNLYSIHPYQYEVYQVIWMVSELSWAINGLLLERVSQTVFT